MGSPFPQKSKGGESFFDALPPLPVPLPCDEVLQTCTALGTACLSCPPALFLCLKAPDKYTGILLPLCFSPPPVQHHLHSAHACLKTKARCFLYACTYTHLVISRCPCSVFTSVADVSILDFCQSKGPTQCSAVMPPVL